MTIQPTETTYFIASGLEQIHYGSIEPGQEMTTCQPYIETFSNEEDMNKKLIELGVIVIPIEQDDIDINNTEN